MEITRTDRDEAVEIKLKGRMDAMWSDHVAAALAECLRSGQHQVLVDMAAVDYLSSAGIRVLLLYARQLSEIQGCFGVINASSSVLKVLTLSGLDKMLVLQGRTASAATQAPEAANRLALPQPGAMADIYELDPKAALKTQWRGSPIDWFEGRADPGATALVQFPADVIGIGLGTLVSGEASLAQPLGEFLAAAGAAVCQPADGANKPDYLLLHAALKPEIKMAYGLLGHGGFRRLLRFDKGPQQQSLPFSTIVKACVEAIGSDFVGLAIVAETASLIGASLQQTAPLAMSANGTRDVFSFPGVRDRLSFTAEPAFADSTSLIVGFAALKSHGLGMPLLKPMVPSGELYGHFHAAALPYRPLRKGKVDLRDTVRPLFETEQVLGVLHLLNDWRELSGAGESRLLRGACWCAPATT